MFSGEGPLTFIRYGISRKKPLLRDVKDAYDGLVLPGNVLLYQYKATPTVVLACEKPFFVDPMTYLFGEPFEAFRRRVEKGPKFKPSFERLVQGHGIDPSSLVALNHRSLTKRLLTDSAALSRLVEDCLAFQWNQVWRTLSEASDLMTPEQQSKLDVARFRPTIVVPPYFLYEPNSAGEKLNFEILQLVSERTDEVGPIAPMILVRPEHLGTEFLETVVAKVRQYGFPCTCIWLEAFDERDVSSAEIAGAVDLVRALHSGGRDVVMLYGGFFSLALHRFGVRCVCEGLGYGQARTLGASASQSSGPAPVRYYSFELHRFLTLPDALQILRELPQLICECPVCRRVVRGSAERITLFEHEEELAEIHFLWNRRRERELIASSTQAELRLHLDLMLELYDDVSEITKPYKIGKNSYQERPIVDTGYIRRWREALVS